LRGYMRLYHGERGVHARPRGHPRVRRFSAAHIRALSDRGWFSCVKGEYAVFIDFASLHQKGPGGEARTATEATLFGRALGSLSEWHARRHIIRICTGGHFVPFHRTSELSPSPLAQVLSPEHDGPQIDHVTRGLSRGVQLPTGHCPEHRRLLWARLGSCFHPTAARIPDHSPQSLTSADWLMPTARQCFTESAVASLAKDGNDSLDLGKLQDDEDADGLCVDTLRLWDTCKVQRSPPLTTTEFARQLEQKSFTSKKSDLPTVVRLYEQAYASRLAEVMSFSFDGLEWGDGEAKQLAAVIATGALPKLSYLSLRGNHISPEGWTAIADAFWTLRDDGTLVSPGIATVIHDDDESRGGGSDKSDEFREAIGRLNAGSIAGLRQAAAYRQCEATEGPKALDAEIQKWLRSYEEKQGWAPLQRAGPQL
jgi:hypothetical protein